jgi:predicted ATPase
MLQRILVRELALYSGKKGITSLFYNGKKVTDSISAEFYFGDDIYSYEVEWTENDSLLFREESCSFAGIELLGDGGHKESNALNTLRKTPVEMNIPRIMLNPSWRIYQFHDTSPSSRIKSEHNISNCDVFINDARNLAAFLYRLKQHFPKEYADILNAIQLAAPFFRDFVLDPMQDNNELIVLRWQQKDCEDIFNASQLSDGTLRFICLVTLLLQPAELQPATIIIDEPELGLHPFAITIFAELVKKAALNKQLILSTQSVELLNNFEAEDIVIVDRDENGSEFKRLDLDKLAEWLEDDYTLGELWNKNILGGRFAR